MKRARCKACLHEARAAIDVRLVKGEPHRAIAAHYGLTKAAITRHSAHARSVTAAKERTEAAHERTVLDQVRELADAARAALKVGLDAAAKLQIPAMSPLDATRELGRLLELEAKLTGVFAPKKLEVTAGTEDRATRLARLRSVVAALESAEDIE